MTVAANPHDFAGAESGFSPRTETERPGGGMPPGPDSVRSVRSDDQK